MSPTPSATLDKSVSEGTPPIKTPRRKARPADGKRGGATVISQEAKDFAVIHVKRCLETGEPFNDIEMGRKFGISESAFMRARDRAEGVLHEREQAVPVAWDTIPGNQREKLDKAKAFIRKELEKEFHTRLLVELDQYRAKLDQDFASHKAAQDAQNRRINAMRDDERRRYQEGIEVYRAKGLITPDEYNVIRSCLHPDSRASATDKKLATAFRIFNESRVKTLLVKEK